MSENLTTVKIRPETKTEIRKHVIIVRVLHNFGVLTRITSLFAGRGYNIESLTVGKTNEPNIARITIVVEGDERIIEQIIKQLRKLIETVRVRDITNVPHIERELALIKVHAGEDRARDEIMRLVSIFRAKVVDVYTDTYTVEITGDREKIEAFIDLLRPFGIKDIARTGLLAITRESAKRKLEERMVE
ncbi:MAG TPA: acetolactate synthase small subunit [Persephonella sp.]|uniref:Acetolactate synthase small subunit n=1 Tax=Persephonella marina (strain DSM 14350 / EX-H1) TaxID=123214 RepID=C0QTE0_PERMH|nr:MULTISPECIES: acetolactate synthase small subunit [Persephonella]ACO03913.1 acetolactate synthase, small subunit [Persephonella marina EX-H1]HCB70426.1 acetolactate synthase small subunit [Persephonella sp.]